MLYEKLNYVIAIAEEQNLTQAAKRLFISQPALTQYISRLETELGVKLFNRSKLPVTLTEAGMYYLENMKKYILLNRRCAVKSIPWQTLHKYYASGWGRSAAICGCHRYSRLFVPHIQQSAFR